MFEPLYAPIQEYKKKFNVKDYELGPKGGIK